MITIPELKAQNKTADGKELYVLVTGGIHVDVNTVTILRMLEVARDNLKDAVTWVVFCPNTEEITFEDEGRTCRYPLKNIDESIHETIYAILDDYGSVDALQKSIGSKHVTTQYVLTLLFAHEY
ncbi:MAG: hypothetical protein ACTSQE_16125 [Candidatus Heimdallarchaeaceae archaeon]